MPLISMKESSASSLRLALQPLLELFQRFESMRHLVLLGRVHLGIAAIVSCSLIQLVKVRERLSRFTLIFEDWIPACIESIACLNPGPKVSKPK